MRDYNPIVETEEYQQKLLYLIKKHGYAFCDDSWYNSDPEIKEIFPLVFDFFEYLLAQGYERVYLEKGLESYTLDKPVYLAGEEVYVEEIYGQGSDVIIKLKSDEEEVNKMSAYVIFYLKDKKGNGYRDVISHCRSSWLYRVFDELYPGVYDKEAMPITEKEILELQRQLDAEREGFIKMRAKVKEQIEAVVTFNNTTAEKIVAISDLQTDFDDIDEEMAQIDRAKNILETFLLIIENNFQDKEPIFYAGIECWAPGEEPTDD